MPGIIPNPSRNLRTSRMTTRHRILRILQDGRFHSGEVLGERLGISRAAVWKALRGLAEMGIRVDAVTGRGYRLAAPLELLDAELIRTTLSQRGRSLLSELHLFESTESTNRFLMERGAAGAAGGSVCLAETQHAGRGRRGREWVSPFASNLYLSLLWRFAEGPQAAQGLSLAVGVIAAQALEALGLTEVKLKWPNDVLWRGAKLGGILIEMAGESGGPCYVVVGVGINVRMPDDAGEAIDQSWTDLHSAMDGRALSRNLLAAALIDALLCGVERFGETGLQSYLQSWRRLDALCEQPLTVHTLGGEFEGEGVGIDETGALRVRHAGGIRTFHSGDVSVRRRP